MDIKATTHRIGKWAKEKGWWDRPRDFPHILALLHSEISEALEEYRKGWAVQVIYYAPDGKPEGVPIELADLAIRLFDLCYHYEIDLEAALKMKMDYNETRSYRHGGKKA